MDDFEWQNAGGSRYVYAQNEAVWRRDGRALGRADRDANAAGLRTSVCDHAGVCPVDDYGRLPHDFAQHHAHRRRQDSIARLTDGALHLFAEFFEESHLDRKSTGKGRSNEIIVAPRAGPCRATRLRATARRFSRQKNTMYLVANSSLVSRQKGRGCAD